MKSKITVILALGIGLASSSQAYQFIIGNKTDKAIDVQATMQGAPKTRLNLTIEPNREVVLDPMTHPAAAKLLIKRSLCLGTLAWREATNIADAAFWPVALKFVENESYNKIIAAGTAFAEAAKNAAANGASVAGGVPGKVAGEVVKGIPLAELINLIIEGARKSKCKNMRIIAVKDIDGVVNLVTTEN